MVYWILSGFLKCFLVGFKLLLVGFGGFLCFFISQRNAKVWFESRYMDVFLELICKCVKWDLFVCGMRMYEVDK